MKEELHKWYSPTLNKEMVMLEFGHAGFPVILFPTTMGRYYENRDFKLVESARWYVEQGLIQIYCPDSINELSWYNKEIHPQQRVRNHVWYDQFILDELVQPILDKKGLEKLAVAGPSFGGYQAANFAFRHPDKVSHMMSMSGSFDIKSFLDGYYDNDVYFNNPVDYLPDNDNPELWKMKIMLGAGQHDVCLDSTQDMSNILNAKNIDHWLDVHEHEKHDWPLWRRMFPHYLSKI